MSGERNWEIDLFDEAIRKVQAYLKPIGLQFDYLGRRTIWKRLQVMWWFSMNTLWITTSIISQIAWLIHGIVTGKSFIQLTNLGPCLALCLQSNIQTLYFVKHGRQVCELVQAIRTLQSITAENKLKEVDIRFLKSQMKMFYFAVNSLTIIIAIGVPTFGISPLITIALNYYNEGEIKLVLPFLLLYPFDTTDIRFWPIAYIHQMWAAVFAVLAVLGPYFLYYACSAFVIFQFYVLQNDLENVVPFKDNLNIQLMDEEFKKSLYNIIDRHRKLIECVDLMEFIYTESFLLNVITSTLLICLTGFNVTAIKDFTIVVPFLEFLTMGFVQIYFLCYYGDMIMIYSMKVTDAAYNCQWYRAEKSIVTYLMIISARARKPCKMTALKFSDVNFKTFTKILSSSWSYFALLTSLYRE
ncbi:putative odorant receptor 92a [Vanessa cardui]|uniref:putative odorant receptor 92a n=1 Tax=Vanessa cardui TaxID=171605 RepID=UPI001F140544|nr:putative odorant receptor 92a [Vanessa cardui]